MTRVYTFQNCEAGADYLVGFTVTQFPDGTACVSRPNGDETALTGALGYGSDRAMFCREEMLLQTWLMERLGFSYSPLLWAMAHGLPFLTGPAAWGWELDLVHQFQRVLNTPALARNLPACIHRDGQVGERWINWIDLRKQAWRLLREPEEQGGKGWRAPQRF